MPEFTALLQEVNTWATAADGTPYVATKTTTLDLGQTGSVASKVEQTVDGHGNVTQTKVYDYGASSPTRTYDRSYVTGSAHTSKERWNLLSSAQVTAGGQTLTLVTNTYDAPAEGFAGSPKCTGAYTTPTAGEGLLTKQTSFGRKRWDWFLGVPAERGSTQWVGLDRLGSVRAMRTGRR